MLENLSLRQRLRSSTTPIVVGVGQDPVKLGLVESLARPVGNDGRQFLHRRAGSKTARTAAKCIRDGACGPFSSIRPTRRIWNHDERCAGSCPALGGFISYDANISILFERAAGYVDRILKGEKPANLPVQQATAFEILIAAAGLGLTLPASVLVRTDEVIE